ncbi:hypothetical protein [Undibacterium sp. Ji22W]|uniref:hypothetical protein n=1 Tax=Undibacterium sp. Ji22W TaxID=3413038 RepID=UPI003BF23D84
MKKYIFISLLFACVIGLWIAYPFIISQQFVVDLFPKGNWASRGVVGDSFGALNTLFSGLALAGLAVNIYLQSVQLKKLEAKEEENSKRLDLQSETLSLTALLNYHNSEIDRLTNLLISTNGKVTDSASEGMKDSYDNHRKLRKALVERLEANLR